MNPRVRLEEMRRAAGLPARLVVLRADERDFQPLHLWVGRLSAEPMGCITFCSCGASFYRDDPQESDRAHSVHVQRIKNP